jgi:hypothetical protein
MSARAPSRRHDDSPCALALDVDATRIMQALFAAGHDTAQIAAKLRRPESVIANTLARAREAARASKGAAS